MRLLFFGTYDVRAHPRVGILREGLREHGADVHECNVPLGLRTAARVSILQNPLMLPRLGWRLLTRWAVLVARSRRYRGASAPEAVVVGYLGHFDVLLARRLFPDIPIVLDHLVGGADTAADRGVRGGVRQRLLRRLDAMALGAADVVVVDTEEHRDALPARHRDRALVVAVGASSHWYAGQATGRVPDGPLRVVFVGLFTPLHGAPVIGAALAALAGAPVEVTMVGSGQELAATKALAAGNASVRWLDWVGADELPALVAENDVALGIFGTGPKARRVVPTKVFQGAAAGCALVTSDTPPQRRVLGSAATYVPAGDPSALAAALRDLASDRERLARARAAAAELAKTSFTPGAVTAPLLEHLLTVVRREVS